MPWRTARAIYLDPMASPKRLTASSAAGDRILNAPDGKVANIVTTQSFGDLELYLEFMVPAASNSGVYLHGLYEVQVFDSYRTNGPPKTSDAGAIYHRWIDGKPVGGSPPKVNASFPPGQWQSFHIWFRAPRFDGTGRKTGNAKFVKVLQNGMLVQENVEIEGGTRSHMPIVEAARNPIMLQGDHGPVAYRNIFWKEYIAQ